MLKVNRNKKLKSFRFTDNYNIDYSPYYMTDNGIYKIYDKVTMVGFMYKYGIYCGAERRIENGKVVIYYNDNPLTEQQKEFIRKRAISIADTIAYKEHKDNKVVRQECGCKKKKETETTS